MREGYNREEMTNINGPLDWEKIELRTSSVKGWEVTFDKEPQVRC